MFELILVAALSSLNVTQTASISPCIWPKCVKPVEVAQVQPCIWPKCSKPENILAKFAVSSEIETCQWPKKCAASL